MRLALLLLLLVPSASFSQSGAASAPSASTVMGALNFRDIGGIRTVDGHVVRTGLIYRSGELSQLTERDFQALAPKGVRYIFDLRTDAERLSAPTHWTGDSPTIVSVSVGFARGEDPSQLMKRIFQNGTGPTQVTEGMRTVTARIAIEGAPEIGRILHELAGGDEPAILHCTAGKDRTGMVTAVLLRILGVSQDVIYADYLRSNDAVPGQMARLRAASTAGTGGKTGAANPVAALPAESVQVLMGVDRSYLDAAFAAIDAHFGSFDGYVTEGLKLDVKDLASLRRLLLEGTQS